MKKSKKIKKLILQSFREGSLSAWRNRFLSGTTILLGALILFLLNLVFAVKFFANYSLENLEKRADFSIALRENFDSFEFDALRNELKDFELEVNLLDEQNFDDFAVPPRIHVKFKNLREVGDVLDVFKKVRYDKVVGDWDGKGERDFVNLISKLLSLRDAVESASFWITLLFLGGGVLLTFNTFRIVLFSRKDEIYISRLVGAEQGFIIGPFLVEGFLLGIAASLIAIFTFVFILREIEILPSGEIFLYLWNTVFSIEIILAGTVGSLGAYIAAKKYLTGKFDE